MTPLGWHVVLRLEDDRVIAPSPAMRRRVARVLAELSQVFPVLAWRVVDTHLHVLGTLTEAELRELVRRLRIRIGQLHPGIGLLLTRRVSVQNQWHLAEAFRYVLRQDARHGVGSDPYQECSAVLDLLGMRALGGRIARRVREHLPRVEREELVAHLGVVTLEEATHVDVLAEAARVVFALDDLCGNAPSTVAARRAAVHAAKGAPSAAVARALGLTPRAVQRLARADVPLAHTRAVRLQMALRAVRPVVEPFGEAAG